MPDGLCRECLNQTINAYNFRKLSRKSEFCLNQFFSLGGASKEYNDKINEENMISYLVDEPIYSCRFCSKCYAEQTDLNLHEIEHNSIIEPVEHSPHVNDLIDSFKIICDRCDMPFENERDCRDHKREVHRDEQKFYKCECGKVLRSRNGFSLHKKIHRGEKKHVCTVCQQKFFSSTNLNVHARIHLAQKPFACDFSDCFKTFQTKAALETHYRIHTNQKPFICEKCPAQFASLSNLIGHRKIHALCKAFSCSVCDQRFATNQSLKRHFRLHSGDKPFKCTACDEHFISSSAVARHVQVKHTEKRYGCEVCKKKFHLKHVWQRHIKGHNKPTLLHNTPLNLNDL